jgi:serine phosphatase RsbU (regulator of sigma subunit)
MINISLRYRLLFLFLCSSLLIILVVIPYNVYHFNRKEQIAVVMDEIEEVYINLLRDLKDGADFFHQETVNPLFFITGGSPFIERHKQAMDSLSCRFASLRNSSDLSRMGLDSLVEALSADIAVYDSLFCLVAKCIHERGFKDWGVEGEMRRWAHLMESSPELNQVTLLMLRRHEKDYIIRNQEQYITQLLSLARTLAEQISASTSMSSARKEDLLHYLDQYTRIFLTMVRLDNEIGIRGNTGLKWEVDQMVKQVEQKIQILTERGIHAKERAYAHLELYYLVFSILVIVTGIFMSLVISRRVTTPILQLDRYMNSFVESCFTINEDINIQHSKDEIGKLSDNFKIMRDQMVDHLNYFKERVAERTEEVTAQRDKIMLQKEEIEAQRDELERVNQVIDRQKKLVEQRNKNLMDSIRYAKHIQEALLPDEAYLGSLLPSHFVLNKPRDIVSGDFYWADKVVHKNMTHVLFAVADCTGHGVPGAFMSLLGHNGLSLALRGHNKLSLKYILSILNRTVYESLHGKSHANFVQDGMDIALCKIDMENLELEFAGSFRPLVIVRAGRIVQYPGDFCPIGVSPAFEKEITIHKIQLQPDDHLYIFTDGYSDQFGGEEGKKLKGRRFRDLLVQASELSITDQKAFLENAFYQWKGKESQVDDVLVLGIKIDA